MNIFLGITALILCSFFGYLLSLKYVKRKKFYEDFSEFNKNVANGVSFGKNSVKTILKKHVNEDDDSDFYICANRYFDNYKFENNENYLSEEEKAFLEEYLNSIGMNDKTTELNSLSASGKVIGEKLVTAREEEKKFRKLYVKLGFLIGLVFLIALL